MIIEHMRDSITLNSYSEIKGYKHNTVQKVKKNGFVSTQLSSLLAKQSHLMKRS